MRLHCDYFLLFSLKNGLVLAGFHALDKGWQCLYFVSALAVHKSTFSFFSQEVLNFLYEYNAVPHLSFITYIVGALAASKVM